jgi:hypothetical protein
LLCRICINSHIDSRVYLISRFCTEYGVRGSALGLLEVAVEEIDERLFRAGRLLSEKHDPEFIVMPCPFCTAK